MHSVVSIKSRAALGAREPKNDSHNAPHQNHCINCPSTLPGSGTGLSSLTQEYQDRFCLGEDAGFLLLICAPTTIDPVVAEFLMLIYNRDLIVLDSQNLHILLMNFQVGEIC